jgi:hypothetical protein
MAAPTPGRRTASIQQRLIRNAGFNSKIENKDIKQTLVQAESEALRKPALRIAKTVSVPRSGTIPVGVNPTRAIDCSP